MSSPIETVTNFIESIEALDVDRILALASPEITYHNVSLKPAQGRAAFEKQMQWFAKNMTAFEVQIHNIAANGNVVLTERVDVIHRGAFRAEFWVCGTFEVDRNGQVVLWRDYFDYANVLAGMAKALPRVIASAVYTRSGRAG